MMFHLMLKSVPFFTTLFTVLNIAAHVMGTTQAANPALNGFVTDCENKPQPCWYGVILKETTRRDIVRVVRTQGYHVQSEIDSGSIRLVSNYTPPISTEGCDFGVTFDLNGFVVDYHLGKCKGIYIGDVIAKYGLETSVAFRKDAGSTLEYIFPDTDYKIVFTYTGRLRPFSQIESMEIYLAMIQLAPIFTWHGFATQHRYCAFEPLHPACS